MRLTNEEIEQLFRQHSSALTATARRKTRTEEADDIVQNAYLRLLEMDNAAHLTNTKFYLFRIVSNMAIDWLRKQRVYASIFTGEIDQFLEIYAHGDVSEERDLLDDIRIQIEGLPKRKRDVFLLSHIEQLKQPEIAIKLGVSLRTISRDLNDARKRMQLTSEQHGPKLGPDMRCKHPSTEDSSYLKGLTDQRGATLQSTQTRAAHNHVDVRP